MPRLTGTLSLVKLDLKAAQAALDRQLTEILKAGVKAWVERATSIIPVWSGASREVFRGIGDAVGASFDSTPVSRPWHVPNRQGLGRSVSDYSINTAGPIYSFTHSHDEDFYLTFNELADMTTKGFRLLQPGPYNWRAQAKRAYENEVDPRIRKLKFDIGRYVRYTRIGLK